MKIAVDISRALEKKKTGIHNYQFNLFKYLSELDNNNEYVPLFYGRSNAVVKKFMDREIFTFKNRFLYRNLLIKNLVDKFFINMFFHKKSIDLIHSTTPTTIAGLEDITVLTILDLIFIHAPTNDTDFFSKKMLSHAIRKVKSIIAISGTTKKGILEEFPFLSEDRIKVIYLGVNEDLTRINDLEKIAGFKEKVLGDKNIKYILFLGSFTKRKNIINIIKAYRHLLDTKDILHKLVLVGKPLDAYSEMLSIVDRFELKDRVIIKEYLPQDYIPYLLSAADIFVFPSFYEGFGLPVLEAMKCGCPCIVSNVSSLKELFFDSAIMVNPHDITEIAKKIYFLLSDKTLQEKYRLLGLKKASQFSWKRMAQETLRVYKEIE